MRRPAGPRMRGPGPAACGPACLVPDLHMPPMRLQVGAGPEVVVIELQVDVLGLEEVHDPDAGDRAGELSPRVKGVLALEGHAGPEALVVALGRGADPA